MLVIPSIDLRGGRCVRLREGDFATETSYAIEPEELVRRYRSLGARWLHIVDLDGAKNGVTVNMPVIERLARHSEMSLQVGGGIRSTAAIERLLSAGVARVVVGSAAMQRPTEVATWSSPEPSMLTLPSDTAPILRSSSAICGRNAMMRLIYPWVRIQAGIDHDSVNEVVHYRGNAVDTAKSLVKAGITCGSH